MQSKKTRNCVVGIGLTLSLFSGLVQAAWIIGDSPRRLSPTTRDLSCGIGSNASQPPGRFSPVAFNMGRSNPPANPSAFNGFQRSPYPSAGQYPGSQRPRTQPYQQNNRPPHLAVTLSKSAPYLQEAVIYTLRVTTSGNVKVLTPEIPSIRGVAAQKLGEETTQTRTGQGQHRFVTTYRYALTPLRAGEIAIPAATVKGTYTSGQPFELRSTDAPSLQVRPADPSVHPWLPLQSLGIKAQVDAAQAPQVGEPMVLTVTLSATGLAGSQLPSLAAQLESRGFKIYHEKAETSSRLSRTGTALEGQRVERYTLVPQHGGILRTAEVRIPWWNVTSHGQAWAVLPAQTVHVTGPAGDWLSSEAPVKLVVDYWQVLSGAVGAMLVYWLWLWLRARGVQRRLGRAVGAAIAPAWQEARELAARVGDRVLLAPFRRLRHRLVMAMPLAFKVRYCLRRIDCEGEPAEWAQLFQLFITKFVNLPVSTPVLRIAEALIQRNATARPRELMALMKELDAALYGSQALDFKTWKKSLRGLIRPRLFGQSRQQPERQSTRALPTLNPG